MDTQAHAQDAASGEAIHLEPFPVFDDDFFWPASPQPQPEPEPVPKPVPSPPLPSPPLPSPSVSSPPLPPTRTAAATVSEHPNTDGNIIFILNLSSCGCLSFALASS